MTPFVEDDLVRKRRMVNKPRHRGADARARRVGDAGTRRHR
jgi:hypothetical protein